MRARPQSVPRCWWSTPSASAPLPSMRETVLCACRTPSGWCCRCTRSSDGGTMTDVAPASPDVTPGAALAKAALYLRVSTGRQAESDLSIPDQRRQITSCCLAKGWDVAAEFVEPRNSATDDRRPAFQAMIDAALVKPPTFTVIVVHSFSRFFRDQFQFEFYVRKLAKNGVRLISITQDLGDDPMSVMMRQTMTLFDKNQSKENAKHTLLDIKENAP